MRLLLDAHLSGNKIGRPLERRGHDVVAVERETALRGLSDERLLDFALEEKRIVVTCDAKDFPNLIYLRLAAGIQTSGAEAIVVLERPDEVNAS